ncbi:hypothetical protein BDQ17DRAFT_1539740 [Cyathus striatus]|nr:hypothetical protein BDQ17DRAFT_1539740 [Cyathus striatus]
MEEDVPSETPCISTLTGRKGIRDWVVGATCAGVGYGVICLLSFQCVVFLSRSMLADKGKEQRTRNIVLIMYAMVMFILSTLALVSNTYTTLDGILGSACFEVRDMSDPFSVLGPVGSVSFVLTNWAADGLLLWRSVAIYENCWNVMYRYGARFLITILFCYTFVEGVLLMTTASFSEEIPPAGPISYVAISMSLNVLITALIVGRLAYFRRISIHPEALIVVFDIFYLVPFMLRSSMLSIPLQCLVYVQVIAPLMIIQRVALKKAWKHYTPVAGDEKHLDSIV